MSDTTPARWRTLPVWLAAFAALILVPLWYRLPYQPPIFAPFYATRFLLFIPLILTGGLFTLMGFPGIRTLAADKWRASWVLLLLMLGVWMYASAGWAFRREADPQLAVGVAVQFLVAALFVVACASTRLPPSWTVAALIFGLLWNGVLAGQQVALQESAGGLWKALGEFPIGLTQPRISVVQADGVRWLRPYGLLPHPNMLAGFLVMALLAASAWLTDSRWTRWLPGGVAVAIGLWALLLTFSRGSYLSLAVGGTLLLILLRRTHGWNRHLAFEVLAVVMFGAAFAVSYYPYLLARAGEGVETTEQYSAAERTELNSAAITAIGEAPLLGVGAGSLPWRSATILYERGSIVQGNYPHNIWLTVAGELGIVGVVLFGGALICAIAAAYRMLRRSPADAPYRAALLAGFAALIVAGMFDYYPATLLQFQAGWWALVAVALAPSDRPVLDS